MGSCSIRPSVPFLHHEDEREILEGIYSICLVYRCRRDTEELRVNLKL